MRIYSNGQMIEVPSGGGGSNPIGTIISFMGTNPPFGYLICDGSTYNISQYPDLANFFKDQFGTKNNFGGDGETTFAVPDLRNMFLRGYHGESDEKLSGDVGAKQEGTIFPDMATWYSKSRNELSLFVNYPVDVQLTTDYGYTAINTDAKSPIGIRKQATLKGETGIVTNSLPGPYTSRPVNVAVLYCIKAYRDGLSAENTYSTSETRIGTWIDGKPLYKKTFRAKTGTPTNKLIAENILPDMKKLVNIYGGFIDKNGAIIPINYTNGNIYFFIYFSNGSALCAMNNSGADPWYDSPLEFTVEYTKTTDS